MSNDYAERRPDTAARMAVAAQVGRLAAEGHWGVSVAADKPWLVRDVPEHTRREVKVYAAACGITVAEALEEMVAGYLQLAAAESGKRIATDAATMERESEQS